MTKRIPASSTSCGGWPVTAVFGSRSFEQIALRVALRILRTVAMRKVSTNETVAPSSP